jgi:methyl-accepting chemotaxis protein
MVAVSVALVLISVACTSISDIRRFSAYMERGAAREASCAAAGFKNVIEDAGGRARVFRDMLASSPELASLVARGDRAGLYAFTKPLLEASKIDTLMIADARGIVLARPHNERANLGDDQSGNADVKNALSGNKYEKFTSGPSSKLGYYCGGPIKMDGQVIGMFRASVSLESPAYVDEMKRLFGVEASVFVNGACINTTFERDGARAVGESAPEAATAATRLVQEYIANETVLGVDYMACYEPITRPGEDGVAGMLATFHSLDDARAETRSAEASIIAIAVVILIAAAVISYATSRQISRPMLNIVGLAERGRKGDMSFGREDFHYGGGGELGSLVESLAGMVSATRDAMTSAASIAGGVAGQAGKLHELAEENNSAMTRASELAGEVAELCEADADSVGRGTSSVAEMARGADSVASMASDTAEALERTTTLSAGAAKSVNGLVAGIKKIGEKSSESQKMIEDLAGSVNEISKFMGVIGGIAGQTNLLALNAAIEAARAGEAGRGFSVVAEEVRKLAEESRGAAHNVESLVESLRGNADSAISSVAAAAEIVNKITEKADSVAAGMDEALSGIRSANDSIQSIAATAEEQATASSGIQSAMLEIKNGAEGIASKIASLNELTRQTAATGDRVAEAASGMSAAAGELTASISQFKLEPDGVRFAKKGVR